MFASALTRTLRHSLLALALGACASLASAAALHVELDTTGMGSAGWIDLQFNPGNGSSALAWADLSHFVGFNGAIAAETFGSVTGDLASGFRISNDSLDGYNDLFHAVHLGGKVGFDIDFGGAADLSGANLQSVFSVALYGDHDAQIVLGQPSNGSLLTFSWTPATMPGASGDVSSVVFDQGVGGVSPVPEPSTWLMLGAGMALLGLRRRRA
ncbi:MAG: NF038129 family PEP-CTERM protein [Sphingomonadaceae bacterium]